MIYAYIRIGKAKDILANIRIQQQLIKEFNSEKQPLIPSDYPTGMVCIESIKEGGY